MNPIKAKRLEQVLFEIIKTEISYNQEFLQITINLVQNKIEKQANLSESDYNDLVDIYDGLKKRLKSIKFRKSFYESNI